MINWINPPLTRDSATRKTASGWNVLLKCHTHFLCKRKFVSNKVMYILYYLSKKQFLFAAILYHALSSLADRNLPSAVGKRCHCNIFLRLIFLKWCDLFLNIIYSLDLYISDVIFPSCDSFLNAIYSLDLYFWCYIFFTWFIAWMQYIL